MSDPTAAEGKTATSIGSDVVVLVCGEPLGRDRPLDAETVARLESYGQRYAALLAIDDPASGLLALGHDLYRFLDGDTGELSARIDSAPRPLQFEIVSSSDQPGPAGLALLRAPWELLADDRGFLAADDRLGIRLVRRVGPGQSDLRSSATDADRDEERSRTDAVASTAPDANGHQPTGQGQASRSSRAATGLSPGLSGGSSMERPSPSPGRDSALSTADWHAMLALVGEVGEIAASRPAEACAHLTAGLAKSIGSGPVWWSVVGGGAEPDDAGGAVMRSHVHGLQQADLQRWEQSYLRECAYETHPMWPRAFATPGTARSFLRRDLVDDGIWYRSPHVADWSRGFGVDDVVSAIVPVGGGAELCIAAMRPWSDRGFDAREREMLTLLTAHTAWLGRRADPFAQAARNGNGAAEVVAALAPRHRTALELLLSGRSEKEVAHALQVSPRTAHKYVEQIYRAFEVSSRPELMALFIAR